MRRFSTPTFVLGGLAVLVPLLMGSCGWSGGPTSSRPNVLLISLDALRADHLGSHGYGRDTSPFLDELARGGLRFENAFVNTHGTPPSHATILSSLYQESHRVGMKPSPSERRNDAVPEGITMIQEILREAGYVTVAVTDGGFMSRVFGFDRGFDYFFDRGRGIESGRRKLVEILRSLAGDERPVFALLHTYQIHSPYDPPPGYRELFGRFESDFEATNDNLLPIQEDAWSRLEPADVEFLEAMYDGELRYTDDVLRRLFDELEGLGFLDDALILVTSDHGEEFADHGGLLHRVSLYEELLHVPLILHGKGVPATTVERLVSSVDIAPTILAAVGIDAPEIMAGRDLLAALEEKRRPGEEAVFSQYADLRYSIRTPRWKLIESPKSRRLELYDLKRDPDERHDLAQEQYGRARRLRKRLHDWRRSCPELESLVAPSVEIPPEAAERLKTLGYTD